MAVFEAGTLESLGRIDAGEGPTHVRAGPENRFYVTDTRGDAVLVYAARPELEQLDRVSLPGSPYGIAIDPERNHLWVTLTADQQLVQFALEGRTLREIARSPPSASRTPWPWTRPAGACSSPAKRMVSCKSLNHDEYELSRKNTRSISDQGTPATNVGLDPSPNRDVFLVLA